MSPRRSRTNLSTYTYFHVCTRGNNGQEIFIDNSDRVRYLTKFEIYRHQHGLSCYAYCLMSNHIHLLVRSPSIRDLSKAMQKTNVSYAMYFNLRHKRGGHLFQDRFSSWVIKDESHLFSTKAYIENNPIEANLAQEASEYKWSSAYRDGSFVTILNIKTYQEPSLK